MSTITIRTMLLGLSCALSLAGTPANAAAERAEELTFQALDLEGNLRRGVALYREHCADCHGSDAYGDAQRDIPGLAAQRRAYIVKQLADFIEGDRIALQMHKVVTRDAIADPQSWADLALYLNNLPPPPTAQKGDGRHLSLGEASYEQFCFSCHEADGRGDDDGFVPSVRNQHYRYLLKEMRNLARGHRFNVESELSRFLDSMQAEEVEGLADYMSRMSGPVRDRTRLNDDGTVSD